MKILHIIAIVALTTACCQAQDKMPMQLRTARSKYDAAVKTVVDPIRQRYLEELNRMRTAAMNQKNLDLANAIDAEITAVSIEMGRTPDGLAGSLSGTTWSWGVTLASATSTLRFLADGTYTVNNEPMGKWSVLNGNSVRLENGSILKFSRDLREYEGTTPSGSRAGAKR